jgi:hypothetical protein
MGLCPSGVAWSPNMRFLIPKLADRPHYAAACVGRSLATASQNRAFSTANAEHQTRRFGPTTLTTEDSFALNGQWHQAEALTVATPSIAHGARFYKRIVWNS